jgi:hypothetical protein
MEQLHAAEVSPMPKPETIKQLIGQDVTVHCVGGGRTRGHLLNANRRSLWLVAGDEDRFIPLVSVAQLRAAG